MEQGKKTGRIPVDEAATAEEIVQAFNALSENELRRLNMFADKLAFDYSSKFIEVYSGEDLFQEAVLRTLDIEKRRWRKGSVSFITLLFGIIKSVAGEWCDKNIEGKFQRVSPKKEGPTPIECMESPGSNIEERIIAKEKNKEKNMAAKQKIDKIKKHFEEDPLALEVIDGWGSGWGGPEIKEVLGLDQTQYETVVKRIRRGGTKIKKEGEVNGK